LASPRLRTSFGKPCSKSGIHHRFASSSTSLVRSRCSPENAPARKLSNRHGRRALRASVAKIASRAICATEGKCGGEYSKSNRVGGGAVLERSNPATYQPPLVRGARKSKVPSARRVRIAFLYLPPQGAFLSPPRRGASPLPP